jgi:hypothetical protein
MSENDLISLGADDIISIALGASSTHEVGVCDDSVSNNFGCTIAQAGRGRDEM